jgi:hypothetical protein
VELTGNAFAILMLLAWMPLSVVAFRLLPPARACALCIVGGVLLLPAVGHLRLPGLAAFSKETIPPLWALVGLLLAHPRHVLRHPPLRGVEGLFFLVLLGALGTGLTNADGLRFGSRIIPGVGLYETLHVVQYDVLTLVLPFYIGRLCYRGTGTVRELLLALVVGLLLYAPLILWESRMSPHLHAWIYGAAPIVDFNQTMRGGGWRPNVFFSHGLALAVFVATAVIAATPFAKYRWPIHGWRYSRLAYGTTLALLVLCRSAGGFVYGAAGTALGWLGRSNALLRAASAVALLAVAYPFLRTWGLFPDGLLVGISERLAGWERAASLEFRFENETALMSRAMERPFFGWGPFGRAIVYDLDTGDELAVRDGAWIILLGERGLVGFAGIFGPLLLPVLAAAARLRYRAESAERRFGATLAFIVAVAAVDLLPNGLFNFLPFFLAGALAGFNAGLAHRTEAAATGRWSAGAAPRRPSPTRRAPAPATR